MKVTPASRKFGKYEVGDVFEMKDNAARLFIKVGKLKAAEEPVSAPQTYQNRMMTSEAAAPAPAAKKSAPAKAEATEDAPFGYTQAGTPRKRPAPAAKKAAK